MSRVARLFSGFVAVTLVPVSVVIATPVAQAGDLVKDPIHDFDCDNKRDELGVDEWATVDGRENAGEVMAHYSSATVTWSISQATSGISGSPETDDKFGSTFAVFDENGDGCDDLVVGAPGEDVKTAGGSNQADAGMVWIIPGSRTGLNPKKSTSFHLDSTGMPGSVSFQGEFGAALAAGTANGKSFLAVGAPGDKGGAVYYRSGGKTHRLTQDSSGVSGAVEWEDRFGQSLSATDRYLAVGAPDEWLGEPPTSDRGAGMVHVFGHALVDGHLKQLGAFHTRTPGITDPSYAMDGFGTEVVVTAYRPSPQSPIVPLVSVGAPDYGAQYGMAYLVVVEPGGKYTELAAVQRGAGGIPGPLSQYERLGADTQLAIRGSSTVGSPETTVWTVSTLRIDYDEPIEVSSELYVFTLTGGSPDNVTAIDGDDFGLGLDGASRLEVIDASGKYLYVHYDSPNHIVGVPWGNILDGETAPNVTYDSWS